MKQQQFRKLQKLLSLALQEAEKEAINEGIDITSDQYQEAVLKLREIILNKLGLTVEEYDQLKADFKKKPTYAELEDKPEIPVMPTPEEIKEIAKEVIPPPVAPQIINKTEVIERTTKVVEKPTIKVEKTKEIVRELDTTETDKLRQDLSYLQESFSDLYNKVGNWKIPVFPDYSGPIKELKDFADNASIVMKEMPNWRALGMGLQGQIDEVRTLINNENLWDWNGTSITQNIANRPVDLGSGNLTTTGKGTFGSTYQAVLGDDGNTRAGYFVDGTNTVTIANSTYAIDTGNGTFGAALTSATYAGYFYDGSSNTVALADGTYAINASGNIKTTGVIFDASDSSSVDVNQRTLYDNNSATLSVDWNNRILYASDGSTAMLDWSTDGTADFGANNINTTGLGTLGSLVVDTNTLVANVAGYTDKVGIGTATPTYKLDVKGTVAADGIRSDMGFDMYFVPRPTFTSDNLTLTAGGSNLGIGAYIYAVTYTTALGETESSTAGATATITTNPGNRKVTITIPVSTDPRVTGRKIYRTAVGDAAYNTKLLTTIANNTDVTYLDDIPDGSLTGVAGADYFRSNNTSKGLTMNGSTVMSFSAWSEGNTFVGFQAGNSTLTNGRNIGFGPQALTSLTSGGYNLGIGTGALGNTTSGGGNIGMGYLALLSATTTSNNMGIGLSSFYANTGGSANVGIGNYTGFNNINGSGNVFLGYAAGRYETGSNKLFIDNQTRTNEATSRTNSLIYGDFNATVASQQLTVNAGTLNFNAGTDADLTINFTGTTSSGQLKWMEDEDYFEFADTIVGDADLFFIGDGSGLPYGSFTSADVDINWTQASAAQNTWYDISDTDFADGNGGFNLVTHDGSGQLTVTKAGRYLINYTMTAEASAANVHIESAISVSGTESTNGIGHGHFVTANAEVELNGTAILDLAAGATINLSIRTTDAGTPNLKVDMADLTIIMVGGT